MDVQSASTRLPTVLAEAAAVAVEATVEAAAATVVDMVAAAVNVSLESNTTSYLIANHMVLAYGGRGGGGGEQT